MRGRSLLRHRGSPVLLGGRARVRAAIPLRHRRHGRRRSRDGKPRYTQIWAFDRRGEKRAFEELIDFITARRERNPGLHVYHYNHYEPTSIDHLTALHETREEAVGRLMGRFATHEDEVDDLFRLGVFVDLYRVVRQGLRAGVESYSIKRLEPLVGYERLVDLARRDDSPDRVRGLSRRGACGGGRREPARRRWLQRGRLPLHARAARLARGATTGAGADGWITAAAAGRRGGGARDRRSRRRAPQAGAGLAAFPTTPASAPTRSERRRCLPTCWSGTGVRPSQPGGATSDAKTLTSAELVDERDAIGELRGRRGRRAREAVGRAAVLVSAAGARLRRRRLGL